MYQNFNYSLQQIPCNTASTAQYSLARNCTNCATDYKNWLCAVSIPRCEDFSSQEPYLQPRNVAANFINGSAPDSNGKDANATLRERLYANSSRNSLIDEQIQPGPYKELLPCEDLCYSLVQSCPAKLGFACPQPGLGLEFSYGKRSNQMSCSYLGAFHGISASTQTSARPLAAAGFAALASILIAVLS
jgi:calcium channel MID1